MDNGIASMFLELYSRAPVEFPTTLCNIHIRLIIIASWLACRWLIGACRMIIIVILDTWTIQAQEVRQFIFRLGVDVEDVASRLSSHSW